MKERLVPKQGKGSFLLLPGPQDSCGIAEVAESILDSALCSVQADNSTALPARAGLRLSTGNVSKTG